MKRPPARYERTRRRVSDRVCDKAILRRTDRFRLVGKARVGKSRSGKARASVFADAVSGEAANVLASGGIAATRGDWVF
jgi:hypothetical protein